MMEKPVEMCSNNCMVRACIWADYDLVREHYLCTG